MLKFSFRREDLRWPRLGLAALYFGLLTTAVLLEAAAHRALTRARAQVAAQEPLDAAATYHRLLQRYPLALALTPARQSLLRLRQAQPGQVQALLADSPMTWPQRWLGPRFRPELVDCLPLWSWPLCGLVLLLMSFLRLGRYNQWAVAALALAALAAAGTLLIWGWYGFPIDRWISALARVAAPLLSTPWLLYLATWALIAGTVALVAAPWRRPRPPQRVNHRIRPASPTDPRMALQHLNAQKAEKRCSASEHAHRREAILASI